MDQYRYYIIPQFVVYIIAIAYLALYDVYLASALAIVVVILIIVVLYAPKFCEDAAWATEHATNILADETDDVFNNLVTVYSHDEEEYERERLEKMHDDYIIKSGNTIKCTFKTKISLFPLIVVFISYFMYRCFMLVKAKKLDSGKFVSLFLMTFYVTNSMWGLIGQIREVVPRWGRIKENITIYDNMDVHKTSQNTRNGNVSNITMSSGLNLNNVWYRYLPQSNWIVKGLNLHINSKERIALVGRIGSGKTTVLKLIMGYKTPQKGTISIDGLSYTSLKINELRRMIGYIHQYPILFNRTIYENIVYGNHLQGLNITKDQIYEMLNKYGISDIFANQPKGLDSDVGRKGHKLSGGQRQMVWLLRVMLLNPKILILDEPTASVDDQTRTQIFKMLDAVMEGRTVIIVTHDKKLMEKVDRVVVMHNGVVIESSDNKVSNVAQKTMEDKYLARPDINSYQAE
jgi:ABC-type multidrug transport system fused ATPase/permease subunit